MYRFCIFIFLFLLLFGCAPATFEGLKEDRNVGRYQFESQKNYQEVFRIVVNKMRECTQSAALFGGGTTVQGDLYTDIKKGEITLVNLTAFGSNVPMGISITSIDDTKTAVDIYYYFASMPAWKRSAEIVEEWVEKGYQKCR